MSKQSLTPFLITSSTPRCPLCDEPQDYNHLHGCCYREITQGGSDRCPDCGQDFQLIKLMLMYQSSPN